MPRKPKIPCSYKGCPVLIESGTGGRCDEHRRLENKRYNNSRSDKQIIKDYGTPRWKRLRKIALQRDLGWCCRCKSVPATLVDHIEEIKDGGDMWNLDNLQSLCDPCHAKKTAEEAQKRDSSAAKNNFIS